jgi:hypothetical protein
MQWITKEQAASLINQLTNELFDIQLVTCWDCWAIQSHKTSHEWELECKSCWYEDELSSFPDLFY